MTNIWIVSFATLSQTVHLMLPGRQPLELFLCSGLNPSYESQAVKINTTLYMTLFVSLLLSIIIPLKIKLSQRINKVSDPNFGNANNAQNSLSDFRTSFLIVCFVGLGSLSLASTYSGVPSNINKSPFYIITYASQLLIPNLVSFMMMFLYFVKNKPLRSCIFRETKVSILNVYSFISK